MNPEELFRWQRTLLKCQVEWKDGKRTQGFSFKNVGVYLMESRIKVGDPRQPGPFGSQDLAVKLGDHLRHIRRPGKAILISDFLVPAASYQQGNTAMCWNWQITVAWVEDPKQAKSAGKKPFTVRIVYSG